MTANPRRNNPLAGTPWLDKAGPHVPAERLDAYATGALSGHDRAAVRQHLRWCAVCPAYVREYLEDQPARVYAFVPRRVRIFGWEATASMAAGDRAPANHERQTNREVTVDYHVSNDGRLTVTVSRDDEPLVGWAVLRDRVDEYGAVLNDAGMESTDVQGRATFASGEAATADRRYRISVIAPGE